MDPQTEWEELCRRRDMNRLYREGKEKVLEEWKEKWIRRKEREDEEKREMQLQTLVKEEEERSNVLVKEREERALKEEELRKQEEEIRKQFVDNAYMRRKMEQDPRFREIYSEKLAAELRQSRKAEFGLRLETLNRGLQGTVTHRAHRALRHLVNDP